MDDGGAFTVDTILGGRVTLLQPSHGFRASLDPILLARFVAPPFGRFLDIGCGTGAVSFVLLALDQAATGVGVELQAPLAALASEGRARNGWADRLDVRAGDVRGLDLGAACFDLVVTNPPFRPVDGGHLSPHETRALSSHEVTLTLAAWVDVAARAVRPGGRVAAIFPADRALELGAALRARDLAPARLRFVHPRADRPAGRVLVEAVRGGKMPVVVEPPLVVHGEGEGERFTPEVARMLGA
ncbi:MAG TPA: methyltransferase [Polyangia bacterium]|nr:methyltransferase [Polyangia bacterium]